MVLTSNMKKEMNKERLYNIIKEYYGNNTMTKEEPKYIDKISESSIATNDVIEVIKSYIKKNDKNISEEKKEKDLRDLFEFAEIRMNSNDEYAEKGNRKNLSNMEKINDITSKYFENSNELEFVNKNDELRESIEKLKEQISNSDEGTNVLISWLKEAVENEEEKNIENYLDELYDAMEYSINKKDTERLIEDLKELNPKAEIEFDGYNIDSLVSGDKLVLPENYEYDDNIGINNKNTTNLQNYVSMKVNLKSNDKGGIDMINSNNKTKLSDKVKPVFRKFKNLFIKEKEEKKERKLKFRKFKNFFLSAGTKISKMSRYIKNKFVNIKNYLEEKITINIDKDKNITESDFDISDELDDNNIEIENQKDLENNKENSDDKKLEIIDSKTIDNFEKSSDQKNNNTLETLGSLVERCQMLGYEVELRKNNAISYYKEHEEEIKKGSKKQLEKYASKLSKIKELETEYSILKHKIEARRKFEAKKIDQLFNDKYEKRDNIIDKHLTNINDLEQQLEYRKMKATNYYKEHEEEIKKGSKKQLEKYASKLSKLKEVQNEYDITNTKYNSLRKEKESSYNAIFR